jgi:nicotinamidase-related amidase
VLVICGREATELSAPAADVVEAATSRGIPVVHVSTGPPGGAATGLRLPGPPADEDVRARGWDGFYDSGLDAVLRRHHVDRLLLVGDCLETGVHSTLRSANDRGYECLLVADACTAAEPSLAAPALSMIEMSGGIFGAVGHAADVLRALAPNQGEPT